MNSENIKTSDPYRLLMNLLDKVNLKKCGRCVDLSILNIYSAWKNIETSYKNNRP